MELDLYLEIQEIKNLLEEIKQELNQEQQEEELEIPTPQEAKNYGIKRKQH
jgi:hypothetical protein